MVLVVCAAGCGRALRHGAGVDSGGADIGPDMRETGTLCLDASDSAIQAPNAGDGWCGGEISVSGSTPFGPFCPTQIRATVGVSLCRGTLGVALADGRGSSSNLVLSLPELTFGHTSQSWVGTHQVSAYLESKLSSQSLVFPATVEVTASDDPYLADAGSSGLGPLVGEVHLRFEMQSSAGLLSGTLVARYCQWVPCLP